MISPILGEKQADDPCQKPEIVNGYIVNEGEHPGMVAIRNIGDELPCGNGVLIHPHWVLTAAHVVEEKLCR